MSKTGISIKVANTVMGTVPQVNANSMLVVGGAVAATSVSAGNVAFTLGTPFLFRSTDDLAAHGITDENNHELYRQVSDFYTPVGGVNNTGTILWVVGVAAAELTNVATNLKQWIRDTVANGFQYRPRNIMLAGSIDTSKVTIEAFQKVIDEMYTEGFATVGLIGGVVATNIDALPSLATENAGMVGVVIINNDVIQSKVACVGLVGGYMASLSVGTSIGDVSLTQIGTNFYFIDTKYTPCSGISLNQANTLGEKMYIFARTRPPKNGLWFNDGATANDDTTALSTLEAARTIASMVDDLRTFFTPFINSKVPCDSSGNIRADYKAVVLSNAREQIIIPYIESGDISDAAIDLRAVNDDMIGTRTWEVTLSILPAPTLRWIDGYVFYVKSL